MMLKIAEGVKQNDKSNKTYASPTVVQKIDFGPILNQREESKSKLFRSRTQLLPFKFLFIYLLLFNF